ncbi:MAG: peroxiredoxin family protein, partial [Proteobacteria bacterium]|nr:peroxiredoxin family protein [Pseudomonadota bacterium]
TAMMKYKLKSTGVASVEDLCDLCIDAELRLIGCQMTIDLCDMAEGDFIDEIELGGAATYFEYAGQSDINLYI